MANPVRPRLVAAVISSILPPAAALIWLTATGAIAPLWVALTLFAGLAGGALAAYGIVDKWKGAAARFEDVAEALERRQTPPSHLVPEEDDSMSRAERRLLRAADTIAEEVEGLHEQRDEFEAILRSMSEAVVVTGRRGDVILLNGAARRLFGLLPEGTYRGREFVELCRDPRLQDFVSRETSEHGEISTAEILIQNPSSRYLEVSAAPVRQAADMAGAMVFVFHDITRLKSYETARADFVANLTHELRTPLTALYGYAETLQQGVDDPDTARRFLGIIERQSRRLARLIDDLISLSDLERGLTPLQFEPLVASRALEEAAELMREQARRTGVTVVTKPCNEMPEVPADRDRLQQVLLNLLDNAIKYTPRGGSVTVSARPAEASVNGSSVARAGIEFVVADTGEGIPAADVPRLTERFYRVDRARSRELGGTGLGLAIVKHIVQLHHGAMRIESRLREGTTVTIWLPLAQSSAPH